MSPRYTEAMVDAPPLDCDWHIDGNVVDLSVLLADSLGLSVPTVERSIAEGNLLVDGAVFIGGDAMSEWVDGRVLELERRPAIRVRTVRCG